MITYIRIDCLSQFHIKLLKIDTIKCCVKFKILLEMQ